MVRKSLPWPTGNITAEQADILNKGGIVRIDGLPGQFTRGTSRRPGYKLSDGMKLLWSELNNKKTGQPYVQKKAVEGKFRILLDNGWTQVAGPIVRGINTK